MACCDADYGNSTIRDTKCSFFLANTVKYRKTLQRILYRRKSLHSDRSNLASSTNISDLNTSQKM